MARPSGLPLADEINIKRRLERHIESRDVTEEPDEGEPVTITIGSVVIPVGRLAPAPRRSARFIAAVRTDLENAVRTTLHEVNLDIRRAHEIDALFDEISAGEMVHRLAALPTTADPLGPVVASIRQRRGITLEKLAAAMQRDTATVRRWERGDPRSQINGLDEQRAASLLGVLASSIGEVAWSLQQRAHPAA